MICLSPYEREISSMRRQEIPWATIYKKYRPLMNYKSSQQAFTRLVSLHINGNHKSTVTVLPNSLQKTAATVESFAQRMLELGVEKLDNTPANQITFGDVIASQRMLQESKKLKLTEDAMAQMMRKLFAPPDVNFIEGELE